MKRTTIVASLLLSLVACSDPGARTTPDNPSGSSAAASMSAPVSSGIL